MSPLTLGMDALLATLLIAALALGLRLNRRLSALRDTQAGFAEAVGDLNSAAERADGALRALKSASEETHDALLDRIETARGLLLRLEKAQDGAEAAARRAEGAAAALPTGTVPGAATSAGSRLFAPSAFAERRAGPERAAEREEVLSLGSRDQLGASRRFAGGSLRQALEELQGSRGRGGPSALSGAGARTRSGAPAAASPRPRAPGPEPRDELLADDLPVRSRRASGWGR